jgi:hypothetical protein
MMEFKDRFRVSHPPSHKEVDTEVTPLGVVGDLVAAVVGMVIL